MGQSQGRARDRKHQGGSELHGRAEIFVLDIASGDEGIEDSELCGTSSDDGDRADNYFCPGRDQRQRKFVGGKGGMHYI